MLAQFSGIAAQS